MASWGLPGAVDCVSWRAGRSRTLEAGTTCRILATDVSPRPRKGGGAAHRGKPRTERKHAGRTTREAGGATAARPRGAGRAKAPQGPQPRRKTRHQTEGKTEERRGPPAPGAPTGRHQTRREGGHNRDPGRQPPAGEKDAPKPKKCLDKFARMFYNSGCQVGAAPKKQSPPRVQTLGGFCLFSEGIGPVEWRLSGGAPICLDTLHT